MKLMKTAKNNAINSALSWGHYFHNDPVGQFGVHVLKVDVEAGVKTLRRNGRPDLIPSLRRWCEDRVVLATESFNDDLSRSFK